MKILPKVHQLKASFQVTPEIERFVYYYLLEGERCYLIDSGVAGCGAQLAAYLSGLGRRMDEVDAIFLTHAHPDHIGGAAEIRRAAGCKVYVGAAEREWVQDIDAQFAARPIPNFYNLAGASVPVDAALEDGARWPLEPGLTLRVIDAAGHSSGSKALLWEEGGVVFTGDAIPLEGDIPIYTGFGQSLATLARLQDLEQAQYYCAAWDACRSRAEALQKIERARVLLEGIGQTVRGLLQSGCPEGEEFFEKACAALGCNGLTANPLFRRSIQATIEEAKQDKA